jgi:hypothetical protein
MPTLVGVFVPTKVGTYRSGCMVAPTDADAWFRDDAWGHSLHRSTSKTIRRNMRALLPSSALLIVEPDSGSWGKHRMAVEAATSELVKVVALLGAAVVMVPLFRRAGLGSVLGYFAAGLAIGPFGLGWFSDPQAILHTAELGVVMFLFVIGLEMRPSHLWSLRKEIFGLGTLQIVTCAGADQHRQAVRLPWQVAYRRHRLRADLHRGGDAAAGRAR